MSFLNLGRNFVGFIKTKREVFFWLTLLFVFLIPASIPLLRPGFYHFSDEPHIANLYQMVRALESGQIPPRWAPDMSYGYGYPLFNFYYPLPFYLGAVFFVFTRSLIVSLKLVFLFSIFLSGLSMFFWSKKHTNNYLLSLVAAVVYTYTPYRAVDLYVRGALGESFAFIFFPLLCLLLERVIERKRGRDLALFGLGVGFFILSHNLATIFFLPFLFVYALVYSFLKGSNLKVLWKELKLVSFGLVLGLGISSFWWFPAAVERNLLASQTPFNYKDHFPFIKQLLYSPWRYGASNPGIGDDISFQVGIINWFLLAISFLSFVKTHDRKRRGLILFFLFSIFVSLFFMNIRSSFLWDVFPFSSYIQFPWRLLMLTTFFTSSLIIWSGFSFKNSFWLLLGLGAILINFSYFRPSEYFNPSDDYFLSRFFANRSISGKTDRVSKAYKNYSEDYLLLPKWTKRRPESLPKSKITSKEGQVVTLKEITPVHYYAEVLAQKDNTLFEVHTYNFPGWEVRVDGKLFPKLTLEPYGNFGFVLDKGRHEVEVRWKETKLRLGADLVSLFSLCFSGLLILVRK
ncbi:hypothetical protein J7J95_00880 [bacterium]|nr:hypothetical protein [bacterium]